MKQPVILMILDGFGIAPDSQGNAHCPGQNPGDRPSVAGDAPYGALRLGGRCGSAGWADGNSEVGHTNIGAGRVVYQELSPHHPAARNGELEQNPALQQAVEHIARNRRQSAL